MAQAIPGSVPAPAGSLAAALGAVAEPRRPRGWRPGAAPVPLVALLQLAVAAMLCGARSLSAMAQWGRERLADDPELLWALGLPPGRSPCVATLHRVFKVLDVAGFEQALGGWLRETGLPATEPVAIDGKTLRGVRGEGLPGVQLVAVYGHESQAVLAQLRTAGPGHEISAGQEVLRDVPLAGRVVTADALHTQREFCAGVVAAGGDYVLLVKENQATLRGDLAEAFSPLEDGHAGGGRRA